MAEVLRAEFITRKTPDEAAKEALEIVKKNIPSGTNIANFYEKEIKDGVRIAGYSNAGVFHNCWIRVYATRKKEGTLIRVYTCECKEKMDELVNKIKVYV